MALKEEMQMKIDLLEAKLDELKSLKEEKQTVTPHLPQSIITPPVTDVLPPSTHTTPLQPPVNDMPPPQTPQLPPSDSQLTIDRERTRKPLKLNKENSRKRLGSHAMETTKKSKCKNGKKSWLCLVRWCHVIVVLLCVVKGTLIQILGKNILVYK